MPYIISSGEIESGIILENDSMTVLDSGIATTTTVNSGGSMFISGGGRASARRKWSRRAAFRLAGPKRIPVRMRRKHRLSFFENV